MKNTCFLSIICCMCLVVLVIITSSIMFVLYNSVTAKDSDLEQIREATVHLLIDLYEDYLSERQHLSIDKVKYLDIKLQRITKLVKVLDPDMIVEEE